MASTANHDWSGHNFETCEGVATGNPLKCDCRFYDPESYDAYMLEDAARRDRIARAIRSHIRAEKHYPPTLRQIIRVLDAAVTLDVIEEY